MHMEAVQKYVISLTLEEANSLCNEIGNLPSGEIDVELRKLYNVLLEFLNQPEV